jgi:histidyl-tRNA synthetase
VADTLREEDLNVRIDISGNSVGSQLKQADKNETEYAIVIGDDEISNETVTIKTLETGEEETLDVSGLLNFWD